MEVNQNGIEVRQVEATPALLKQSEIQVQIELAKRYPRSIHRFLQECEAMVTLNDEIAASCIYALPRGGKSIEGPSARLAEIVTSAWGNCQAGARVVEEDGKFVTAQGVFRDLERNTCITYEVKRRITGRDGKTFNDDMIGVTANAACSIALRNAVLKGVPKAFWDQVYQQARKTAIGDVKTLATRRAAMIELFAKMGVTLEQILERLDKPGVEDVGPEDLLLLRGLYTALRDGDTSLEDAFGPRVKEVKPKKSASTKDLEAELKQEPAEKTTAKKKAPQPEPSPSDLTPEEQEEYGGELPLDQ
jgi:hypothetical protein